jgi:hypothetical protein
MVNLLIELNFLLECMRKGVDAVFPPLMDVWLVHEKLPCGLTPSAAPAAPAAPAAQPAESAIASSLPASPPFPIGINLPNTAAERWQKTEGIDGAGSNATSSGTYM